MMAELAALLGTIAIFLTFVSSYRVAEFISSGSPAFGLLVAIGVTVSFIIVFEYVLLLFGTLTLLSPVLFVYYRRGRVPVISTVLSRLSGRVKRRAGIAVEDCDDCGEFNAPSNEYCQNCGRKLEDADT